MTYRPRSYEDLLVWQKGLVIVDLVYDHTAEWPSDEKYSLVDQARRAAVAVPANIAEGWGRGPGRAFHNHLRIARGSLYELKTLLEIARRRGYPGDAAPLKAAIDEVSVMLKALLGKVAIVQELTREYGRLPKPFGGPTLLRDRALSQGDS